MNGLPRAVREGNASRERNAALFSSTEQQVLDLAWRDAHHLLMRQSRWGGLLDRLLHPTQSQPLANPRLEALRRHAIALRLGQAAAEGIDLLEAGFSHAQIAMLEFLFGQATQRSAA